MKLALTRPQVSSRSGDVRLAVKAGVGRVFCQRDKDSVVSEQDQVTSQVQDHLTLTLRGPVLSLISEMIHMSQCYYHK